MSLTQTLQIKKLSECLRQEQRTRTLASLRAFGLLYLPHYLQQPPSRMHEDLYPLLEQLPSRPGARIAIAAPRGSAKSTLVSLLFVLWAICRRSHRFIVILSDTKDKAENFLQQVKFELHQNELLAADFPEVCEPGGRAGRLPRWRDHEIITHNGVMVAAIGSGQNIRGRRHAEVRPDLLILDDVESRANTHSAEQREKLSEWFHKSILMAGSHKTQILMVGTILHYDSLLARLTNRAKSTLWEGHIYRSILQWSKATDRWERWSAILHGREQHQGQAGPSAAEAYFAAHAEAMLDGTKVLWPSVDSYYKLMLMREGDGVASFDSEKQNEPVNPADCYFLEEEFRYWDDRFGSESELISSLAGSPEFIGACDPSLGVKGIHGDDSAIITLLRDSANGNLFVLDADIARRKPDQIIENALTYQRMRKYQSFGFEANCFQTVLADELKRRSAQQALYMPVTEIRHTTDKVARIQRLQPLVRSGTLQFSRRHRTLIEQLRMFPKAAHDDGPDALEMAVEATQNLHTGCFDPKTALIGRPSAHGRELLKLMDERRWERERARRLREA